MCPYPSSPGTTEKVSAYHHHRGVRILENERDGQKSHLKELLQKEGLLQSIPLLRDKNAFNIPDKMTLSDPNMEFWP